MTNGSLMKVKSIAEYSPWSILQYFWPAKGSILQYFWPAKGRILQYFWPALSDNWSWKPICGLFESGRLHRF